MPLTKLSKENIINHFKKHNGTTVNIVTGFIASNTKNETTTLGRNGSNYTASLLANYLDAEELQNYTHVNGIYTANPDLAWMIDASHNLKDPLEDLLQIEFMERAYRNYLSMRYLILPIFNTGHDMFLIM